MASGFYEERQQSSLLSIIFWLHISLRGVLNNHRDIFNRFFKPERLMCAGIAVLADMFLTTHFMTLVLMTIWRLPLPLVVLWYCVFAPIEGTYLSSALEKIPTGGCMPSATHPCAVHLEDKRGTAYQHNFDPRRQHPHLLELLVAGHKFQNIKFTCTFPGILSMDYFLDLHSLASNPTILMELIAGAIQVKASSFGIPDDP